MVVMGTSIFAGKFIYKKYFKNEENSDGEANPTYRFDDEIVPHPLQPSNHRNY